MQFNVASVQVRDRTELFLNLGNDSVLRRPGAEFPALQFRLIHAAWAQMIRRNARMASD